MVVCVWESCVVVLSGSLVVVFVCGSLCVGVLCNSSVFIRCAQVLACAGMVNHRFAWSEVCLFCMFFFVYFMTAVMFAWIGRAFTHLLFVEFMTRDGSPGFIEAFCTAWPGH